MHGFPATLLVNQACTYGFNFTPDGDTAYSSCATSPLAALKQSHLIDD